MATIISLLFWSPLIRTLKALSNFYNKLFLEECPTHSLTDVEKSIDEDMDKSQKDEMTQNNANVNDDDVQPVEPKKPTIGSGGSGSGDASGDGSVEPTIGSGGSGSGGGSVEPTIGSGGSGSGGGSVEPTIGSGGSGSGDDSVEPTIDSGDSGSGDGSDTNTRRRHAAAATANIIRGAAAATTAAAAANSSGSEDGSGSGSGSAWESGFWSSPSGGSASDINWRTSENVDLDPALGPGSDDILDSGPGRALILLVDTKETHVGHLLFVEFKSGFRIVIKKFKEDLPPHLRTKSIREKEIHALHVAIRENEDFLKERKFRLLLTSVPLFLYLVNANADQLEFLKPFSFSLAFGRRRE